MIPQLELTSSTATNICCFCTSALPCWPLVSIPVSCRTLWWHWAPFKSSLLQCSALYALSFKLFAKHVKLFTSFNCYLSVPQSAICFCMSWIIFIDVMEKHFLYGKGTLRNLIHNLFICTGCCLDNEILSLRSITCICRTGQCSENMGFKKCFWLLQ